MILYEQTGTEMAEIYLQGTGPEKETPQLQGGAGWEGICDRSLELTLPETNIALENQWLEDYFPFAKQYVQGYVILPRSFLIIFGGSLTLRCEASIDVSTSQQLLDYCKAEVDEADVIVGLKPSKIGYVENPPHLKMLTSLGIYGPSCPVFLQMMDIVIVWCC